MASWINRRGPVAAMGLALLVGMAVMTSHAEEGQGGGKQAAAKAALSVQVVRAQSARWPVAVVAHGAIAPWQEAVIGAELAGLRLSAVNVNVGDRVKRGQVLATLQSASVQADLNSARAALLEAEALLAEARVNANSTRALQGSGALSNQESQRSLTAEQTARARVDSAKAQVAAQALRMRQTRVVAPDDGVVSARVATVGAVVQPGAELFRLIRQSRLEWRAELPSADLHRIKPGMVAWATPPGGEPVQGKVRMVAPTVDAATRNGTVYIDLPASALAAGARAGMFASGRIETGQSQGLTLPQTAVLLREGFSYVFKVNGKGQVNRIKVQVGRRLGDRIEVIKGLDAQADYVASGVGFLSDGDTVRVVKGVVEGKGQPS